MHLYWMQIAEDDKTVDQQHVPWNLFQTEFIFSNTIQFKSFIDTKCHTNLCVISMYAKIVQYE